MSAEEDGLKDPKNITQVIDKVEKEVDSDKLSLGRVLKLFQTNGYGPLLLVAGLIIILPTGGIPGLPTVLGVSIILIAGQLVLGRSSPWLPRRLRNLKLKKRKFDKGADTIKPVTRKIDYILKARMSYLASGTAARFVGLVFVVMALLLPITEFVPFSDIVPGLAITSLALGLTARDGLFIIVGLIIAAIAVTGALYILIFIGLI
jgi:hypothetical protein